ncbi:MEMO1 family [Tricladium varicosporioides]|nr:MEMO1 family [Hymenoscyphus varicosporioides]
MTTRKASHAGSWYKGDPEKLDEQLDHFLAQVPDTNGDNTLPVPGARVIIAPHAGYSYSGDNAAWAYKALDLSQAQRIFLLGPSHTMHLTGCALTTHSTWATPLGDLKIDREMVDELHATGKFQNMPKDIDEQEHSMEMHCPYIFKMISTRIQDPAKYPSVVPVMVGNTSEQTEKEYGKLFAPYLLDETSVFVVSSDFCHWGDRFQYMYYMPKNPSTAVARAGGGYQLRRRRDVNPTDPPIHESIERVDKQAMAAIESGSHTGFLENLRATQNTVCGRHPIGVVMAAIESLKDDGKLDANKAKFKFTQYSRSSDVVDLSDSSVSYASAFAVC